jgi:redox-sensitive bicupin YhaK (pirin superfamily)
VARGRARLNDTSLEEGDGAAVSDEATIDIAADGPAEILVFDLN